MQIYDVLFYNSAYSISIFYLFLVKLSFGTIRRYSAFNLKADCSIIEEIVIKLKS